MSWSRPLARKTLAMLGILAAAGLSACSGFTPVYGDRIESGTSVSQYLFAYSAPVSRYDQVVYAELRLRLGNNPGPDAATITVTTSPSARALTKSAVTRPSQQYEATITANAQVVAATGEVLFTGTRSASALYTTNSQVLADNAAAADAMERAARSVAESLRLAILAALSTGAGTGL
jgi:hypothetical protein